MVAAKESQEQRLEKSAQAAQAAQAEKRLEADVSTRKAAVEASMKEQAKRESIFSFTAATPDATSS